MRVRERTQGEQTEYRSSPQQGSQDEGDGQSVDKKHIKHRIQCGSLPLQGSKDEDQSADKRHIEHNLDRCHGRAVTTRWGGGRGGGQRGVVEALSAGTACKAIF